MIVVDDAEQLAGGSVARRRRFAPGRKRRARPGRDLLAAFAPPATREAARHRPAAGAGAGRSRVHPGGVRRLPAGGPRGGSEQRRGGTAVRADRGLAAGRGPGRHGRRGRRDAGGKACDLRVPRRGGGGRPRDGARGGAGGGVNRRRARARTSSSGSACRRDSVAISSRRASSFALTRGTRTRSIRSCASSCARGSPRDRPTACTTSTGVPPRRSWLAAARRRRSTTGSRRARSTRPQRSSPRMGSRSPAQPPSTVAGWLDRLPAATREQPMLSLLAGRLAMGRGEFEGAVGLCRAAVAAFEEDGAPEAMRWAGAVRAHRRPDRDDRPGGRLRGKPGSRAGRRGRRAGGGLLRAHTRRDPRPAREARGLRADAGGDAVDGRRTTS